MGNVAETVVAYLGCLLAGVRPVCTLPQHGVREVDVLARHVGARGLIIQADFGCGQLRGNARTLLSDGPIEELIVARGAAFGPAVGYDELLGFDGNPPSCRIARLTAGRSRCSSSPAAPPGCPRSHPAGTASTSTTPRRSSARSGSTPASVVLHALPIMHNAGIAAAMQPALLGGRGLRAGARRRPPATIARRRRAGRGPPASRWCRPPW